MEEVDGKMEKRKKERKEKKKKIWESSERTGNHQKVPAPTVTHNAAEARACRGNGKESNPKSLERISYTLA